MCFYFKLSKEAQSLKSRFNAKFDDEDFFVPSEYNGFSFPRTPVIANNACDAIQLFQWGLVPTWAKDLSIRQYTLNARIETIKQKPAFKNNINNRCLIIADGFYEWQWLDQKGKKKQKYLISLQNEDIFTFAGLWGEWIDPKTGEIHKTYTLLTTEANELMSKIHNSKRRMPVIFTLDYAYLWLDGKNIINKDIDLIALPV